MQSKNSQSAASPHPAVVELALRAWTDAKYAETGAQDEFAAFGYDISAYPNPAGEAPDAPVEIHCADTDPTVCNTNQCPTGAQPCFSESCPQTGEFSASGSGCLDTQGTRCITRNDCPTTGWACQGDDG